MKCDARDDDAGRRQPRHRQHRRRLRAAEAGRVRRDPAPADGRPGRGCVMAQFTRQRSALRPVQELQVPGEVGRPLRRGREQGRRAQADDRGGRAPRGRRPVDQPQVAGPHEVRADHARARRHPRHRVRGVGQQGLELRLGPRRGGVAQGLPQGRASSSSTTRPGSSCSPTRSTGRGSRSTRRCPTSTPTPTPSRSRRSSSSTRAGSATTTSPSPAEPQFSEP